MNSLKEGAMLHVDPLLGNDHEISSYTKSGKKVSRLFLIYFILRSADISNLKFLKVISLQIQ
jgi:hypothetical protein